MTFPAISSQVVLDNDSRQSFNLELLASLNHCVTSLFNSCRHIGGIIRAEFLLPNIDIFNRSSVKTSLSLILATPPSMRENLLHTMSTSQAFWKQKYFVPIGENRVCFNSNSSTTSNTMDFLWTPSTQQAHWLFCLNLLYQSLLLCFDYT